MKDINTVLAQKLEELKRCRMDLFCLRTTIRLLTEPLTANEVRKQEDERAIDFEQENVL
jgi:hypothetical protein